MAQPEKSERFVRSTLNPGMFEADLKFPWTPIPRHA